MEKEREVITEFIELFRDLPCLWDLTCKEYRDSTQKKNAWDILAAQLKKIDPAANITSAKKKVDNLKFSYLRESKKVKESKNRAGSDASDIHKPSLWYYKLMTFLEKNHEDKILGADSLKDEEVPQFGEKKRKKKITSERSLDLRKERFMDAAFNLLRTDTELNPFGLYVGKKMEEILPGPQRDIAEKLISDVLFLAKSSRLTFDTKIEIPFSQNSPYNQYFAPSPQQCSTSSDSSNRFHFQSTNRSSTHTEVKPQYISHSVIPPPSQSPVFIESVPPSSQQIPIATTHTPLYSPMQSKDEVPTENISSHSSQITHTNSTSAQHSIITVNEVYTQGPTDILKQMLLEPRPTSPVPSKLEIIKLEN